MGFEASIGLEDGLQRTLDSFRARRSEVVNSAA
jgi:hypothetical protein